MALGKQAKILNKKQIDQLIWYVSTLRHPLRNEVIVLLSVKAGLRAKEIASLTWSMITDPDGDIGSSIHLTDKASKGRSGRVIPLNMQLRLKLTDLLEQERQHHRFDLTTSHVIRTERSEKTSGVYVMRGAGMIDDTGLGVTRDGGSELTLFLNKGAEAATYYQTIKAGEYFSLSEGLVYSNGNLIGQGSVVRVYEEKGEGCCVPDIVVEESTPGPFSGNISGTSLGNSKLIRTGKAGEGRYIITYTGSGLSPVPEVRN